MYVQHRWAQYLLLYWRKCKVSFGKLLFPYEGDISKKGYAYTLLIFGALPKKFLAYHDFVVLSFFQTYLIHMFQFHFFPFLFDLSVVVYEDYSAEGNVISSSLVRFPGFSSSKWLNNDNGDHFIIHC